MRIEVRAIPVPRPVQFPLIGWHATQPNFTEARRPTKHSLDEWKQQRVPNQLIERRRRDQRLVVRRLMKPVVVPEIVILSMVILEHRAESLNVLIRKHLAQVDKTLTREGRQNGVCIHHTYVPAPTLTTGAS